MGMIIVWGWDLVFYYLFVDSAGPMSRYVYSVQH